MDKCSFGFTVYEINSMCCTTCNNFILDGVCSFFGVRQQLKEENPLKPTYCLGCSHKVILTKDDKKHFNMVEVGYEIFCNRIKKYMKLMTKSCNKGEFEHD